MIIKAFLFKIISCFCNDNHIFQFVEKWKIREKVLDTVYEINAGLYHVSATPAVPDCVAGDHIWLRDSESSDPELVGWRCTAVTLNE